MQPLATSLLSQHSAHASAHPIDRTGYIMFSGCPSCACVCACSGGGTLQLACRRLLVDIVLLDDTF